MYSSKIAAELRIIIFKQHKDSSKEIQPITVASAALHYSPNNTTMYIKLNYRNLNNIKY